MSMSAQRDSVLESLTCTLTEMRPHRMRGVTNEHNAFSNERRQRWKISDVVPKNHLPCNCGDELRNGIRPVQKSIQRRVRFFLRQSGGSKNVQPPVPQRNDAEFSSCTEDPPDLDNTDIDEIDVVDNPPPRANSQRPRSRILREHCSSRETVYSIRADDQIEIFGASTTPNPTTHFNRGDCAAES